MNFLPDRRGVSEVLGAILVFALIISVLVIVQVAGVPAANQQIEFEHNARVQADFQTFDQNVDRAAALGAESSSSVETGVRYPPRLFLLNPGPAAGTLSTGAPGSVEFANVTAVNSETNDFFTGTVGYTTTSLNYGPSYNEYGEAPTTTYENGIIYNSDENGAAVVANGNLISGNRISLAMLNGSLSESSTKAVSLQTVPISGPANTVSITNAGSGNPLTLTLSTQLTQADWSEILADEMVPMGGNVQSVVVDESADTVTITLKEGVTYNVRLAKVGVGSGFAEEPAAYVTTASDLDVAVTTVGGTVTAEIRDRFNNPVPGETLYFYSPDGNFTSDRDVSNEQGRVSMNFEPGDGTKLATIFIETNQTADGKVVTSDSAKYVEYGVTVTDAPDPEVVQANQINPNDGSITLTNVEQGTNSDVGKFTLTFENTGTSTNTITDLRLPFYYNAKPGNSAGPLSARVSNGSESVDLSVRGPYVEVPGNFSVKKNQELVLYVQFYEGLTPVSGEEYDQANNDDFFVISGVVSGTPQNYFAAPGNTSGGSTASGGAAADTSTSGVSASGSSMTFTLENSASSTATIQNISVDSVSGNPTVTKLQSSTQEVAANPGSAGLNVGSMNIGQTYNLDTNIVVPGADSVDITLGEFYKNAGSTTTTSGRTVKVTLGYTDGSVSTYTLTVP